MKTILIYSIFAVLLLFPYSCTPKNEVEELSVQTALLQDSIKISNNLPWSQRMAESIMKRNPESWMTDFRKDKGPKWNYTHGLVLMAIQNVGKETGDQRYLEYAKSYADTMTNSKGDIRGYSIENFNIDHINPGRIFFDIYEATGDKRYENVLHTLYKQLLWQPRTSEGGYWHKLRYPHQMWLDGVYMGEPFYARYAVKYNHPEAFDHIANQFILIEKKTSKTSNGLLYHGWDESKIQKWADPLTGQSSEVWGRAVGWYAMALVDVLDYFPENHEKRAFLVESLNRLAESVLIVQDAETGLWYQVMDKPEAAGNYLEATVSSMLTYALVKGVNRGYLDQKFMDAAKRGYMGILDNLIQVEDNGEVHLHKCCSVAGLGGDPYRDGTLEYYMSEPVVSNDTKGTGPFILASLEFEKLNSKE